MVIFSAGVTPLVTRVVLTSVRDAIIGVCSRPSRGSIDELPSGALRVRVYADRDPVSKRRHDLIEIILPVLEPSL